jgi:hypothetical protein
VRWEDKNGQRLDDPTECWRELERVLSTPKVNHPYVIVASNRKYNGYGFYYDKSCAEYLLDDLQFALFEEGQAAVDLILHGPGTGPISDNYYFTFTRDGLVKAAWHYDDD